MTVSQPELDFPRKGEADLFGAEALYDDDLFAAAPPAATGATGTAAAVITISASASGNVFVAGQGTAQVTVGSTAEGALGAAPAQLAGSAVVAGAAPRAPSAVELTEIWAVPCPATTALPVLTDATPMTTPP